MIRTTVSTLQRRFTAARPIVSLVVAPSIRASSNNPRCFFSTEREDSEQSPFIEQGEVEEQRNQMIEGSDVQLSQVLKTKHSYRWADPVLPQDSTVKEAIVTCIQRGLSGMMVTESADDNHVVGLVTSRDLLRILAKGFADKEDTESVLDAKIGEYMTPRSQIIYARPEETIGVCRTIMAKLGIKCIPVLSRDGVVEGLITSRDMTDFSLGVKQRGGKESYLNDVSTRVGLGDSTSMADPPSYIHANLSFQQAPLYTNIGVAEYPHPYKADLNSGIDYRAVDPEDLSVDPEVSEDANFVSRIMVPDEKGFETEMTYVGVADGVGSWAEYGVDPRLFSHRLMEECEAVLDEVTSSSPSSDPQHHGLVAPVEILAQAYQRVKAADIIGSCTACVGLVDHVRHQLHFSNLGDSGIIVLRHIDSDVAGSLKREATIPRTERKSDLRVAFVSQQQLRSFNHPYQLGWTGQEIPEGEDNSFKTARDACTSSIHIRRGDIIIMATDGLFDNVHLEEIEAMALDWEQKNGFIRGGDIQSREQRWAMGNSLTDLSAEQVSALALDLCKRARLNSLDASKDSPFAILAKENDIMWSGGMPDDCSVIVMHVVGRSPHESDSSDQ